MRYFLFFLIFVLYSCQDNNKIRFKQPQPQMLKAATAVNPDFVGTFVIEKDTVVCSPQSINNKKIDSNLIIKNWGGYMFINEKEDDYYRLSVAKISKFLNDEKIELIYPNSKKIDKKLSSVLLENLTPEAVDSINISIQNSYSHTYDIRFYIDRNNIYIDKINFNQLQQLLKTNEAYYQSVKRLE